MAQPSKGPFIDMIVEGSNVRLRWDVETQSLSPAMNVRQDDASYDGIILRIKNEGDGPVFRFTKGGVNFDFELGSGTLSILGNGTEVLRLGTSRPSVTGNQVVGSVAESLTAALASLRLIDDNTT